MVSDANKLIMNNAMLLYSRLLLTIIVGFLTTRVVLEELGASDYGTYFVVGGIVAMSSIINGSMSGAIGRWITIAVGKGNQEHLNKVFAVGMTAQLVIILIAIISYESLGVWYLDNYAVFPPERLSAVTLVFQFSVIIAIIQLISVPFMSVITAHEKMSALVYVAFIDVLIKIILIVVLPIITVDKLVFYAALILLAEILKALFYIYYCKRFEESKFIFAWDKVIFVDMWRIAFWSLSGNFAYMSYTVGITLLINFFFGPAVNAAAGVAGQAVNIVNQFRINFQQAMNPQITKTFAQNKLLEMEKLVIRSSKFSQYLVVVFSVPLFLETPFLLDIWLKDVPAYTVEFIRVGLFVTMVMTMRAPLVTSAMASGDLKRYSLVVISILLLILPFSYFAYDFGASATTGPWISFVLMCIALIASAYMLKDMTGLRFKYYIKDAILPAVLVTIISFIPPYFIHVLFSQEGWLRLFVVSFMSLFTTIIIIYFIGLEERERYVFKSKTINILHKFGLISS